MISFKCGVDVELYTYRDPTSGEARVSRYADGGYPIFYVLNGHTAWCAHCVEAESSRGDYAGQKVTGASVNWENPDLYCENCNERIESAYGEP